MKRSLASARPVVTALPTDKADARRLAAFLGVLSDDLPRLFATSPAGVPLGGERAGPVAEAEAADLAADRLPVTVSATRTRLAATALLAAKVAAIATAGCLTGTAIVEGMGAMITEIPESLLLGALVIPTATAFAVATLSLPVALITGSLALRRNQATRAEYDRTEATRQELSARNVAGPSAALDAYARKLARQTVRARLPLNTESDILTAIEDLRLALRRWDTPSDTLLAHTEDELRALDDALQLQINQDADTRDPSAPLTNLRAATEALRQTSASPASRPSAARANQATRT